MTGVKEVHGVVKRDGWEAGPWDDEADRVEWVDEATGYPCLIIRHQEDGNLCGYTAVPPGHPLHGVSYDGADNVPYGDYPGINYARACVTMEDIPAPYGHLYTPDMLVCHVPAPGEPDDVWWFGFDCGHGHDVQPGKEARTRVLEAKFSWPALTPLRAPWATYRGVPLVTEMVGRLAADLKELA